MTYSKSHERNRLSQWLMGQSRSTVTAAARRRRIRVYVVLFGLTDRWSERSNMFLQEKELI